MKRLRWLTIILILGIAFFFNIERLDIEQNPILNIDSLVYLFVLMAILTTLVIRTRQTVPTWRLLTVWTVLFVAFKAVRVITFDTPPLFSGIYLYMTITELSLLIGLVWLSNRLATTISEFENAVDTITFADSNIQKLTDANEQIEAEMFRSRHNKHPLSVIVVEPKTGTVKSLLNRMVKEAQEAMVEHYLVNTLATELKKQLRRTDLVLVNRNSHRVVLICPETDQKESIDLATFLKSNVADQLDFSVACGVASFPDAALTFDELVLAAEKDLYTEVKPGSTGFFKRTAPIPATAS